MISLNDFPARWPEIRLDVLAAVERVGQRGRFILGEEVACFERELAVFSGQAHAVGCGSGHDAIQLALLAAGLEPGDRVLTTPLSAFATTLAIVRTGGVPVFADVDEDGLLDLDECSRALAADPSLRFVLPVHLYGLPLDTARLAALRDRHEVIIVEDCAQALGARSHGRPVGTAGHVACTSFYPTKNLGCLGDGGAVLTSDAGLAARTRSLRDYGRIDRHVHAELGMNSRLDEVQAAILRSAMLPRLPRENQRRAEVARAYLEGLDSATISLPRRSPMSEPAWHQFPVLVRGERAAFREHLRVHGIDSDVHFPVLIPEQRALVGRGFEALGPLERARSFATREVSLPIHPGMSDESVARVISACNGWRP